MSNEHNPIAQLITRIQQKWMEEVTPYPDCKMARWLIKADHCRLYEGFLHLESTPHGSLPDLFVVLFTPFHSEGSYTGDLIRSWFETYDKDQKTMDEVHRRDAAYNWDTTKYRKAADASSDMDTFLEMLGSFYKAIHMPGRVLTIALMPFAVHNLKEYERWLKSLLQAEIRENIRFCIFDYSDERYFDELFRLFPDTTRSLSVELDLDGAANKIIHAGDSNSPEVQLRKYIMRMSDAVSARSPDKLDRIGKECIKVMTASKIRSLMSTAYIVYGGLLLHFKKYDEIEVLLHKGLKIAEAGKEAGDEACQPLILQYYGFIASNYQLGKKEKQAMGWFFRQAQLSAESGLPLPAITAYRQAAWLARRNDPVLYKKILVEGWSTGQQLNRDELSISDFCFIGLEYYEYLYDRRETEAYEEIDQKMTAIYGADWERKTRDKQKAPATKEPIYVTGQ